MSADDILIYRPIHSLSDQKILQDDLTLKNHMGSIQPMKKHRFSNRHNSQSKGVTDLYYTALYSLVHSEQLDL